MSKDLKQFLVNEKFLDLNDIAGGNIENATRMLVGLAILKELNSNIWID